MWCGVAEVADSVIVAVSLIGIGHRGAVVVVAADAIEVDVVVGIKREGIVIVRDTVVVGISSRRITRLLIQELPPLVVIAEVLPLNYVVGYSVGIDNFICCAGAGINDFIESVVFHSELLGATSIAIVLNQACAISSAIIWYGKAQTAMF